MNNMFLIIWSRAQRIWVVVSEFAKRKGKDGGRADSHTATAADTGSTYSTRRPIFLASFYIVIVCTLLYLCTPAHAADRWWDPNNTAVDNGGDSTWNTTDGFTAVAGTDLELDTPVLGLSSEWQNGFYAEAIPSTERPLADLLTDDSFQKSLDTSNTLDFSLPVGRRITLANHWVLEPRLQLSGTHVDRDDVTYKAGKNLDFYKEEVGTARASQRVEKYLTRPWAALAVENTEGKAMPASI